MQNIQKCTVVARHHGRTLYSDENFNKFEIEDGERCYVDVSLDAWMAEVETTAKQDPRITLSWPDGTALKVWPDYRP